jgi:hypothetical protein
MTVFSVKENGVRNVGGFLGTNGKQRMSLGYRHFGEMNLESGDGGGRMNTCDFKYKML